MQPLGGSSLVAGAPQTIRVPRDGMDPLNGTVQQRYWNGWDPKKWSRFIKSKQRNRPVYLYSPKNKTKSKPRPTPKKRIYRRLMDHIQSNIKDNKQFARQVLPDIVKGNVQGVVDKMVDRVVDDLHLSKVVSPKKRYQITNRILNTDPDELIGGVRSNVKRVRDLDKAEAEGWFIDNAKIPHLTHLW